MEELNLKKINLNDHIYFEFTKATIDAFGNDTEQLTAFIKYHVADYIVAGKRMQLAKMQLWEFISKFGKYLYIGAPSIVESNNIFFDAERR